MIHYLVGALVIRADRILLGLRSPERAFYPNVWDVFGGHIEPGEQPDETLIRELQEELDITPTQWTALETISESIPGRDPNPRDELILHLYCVTAWEGRPVNRQLEEHVTIQWFSYPEAIQLNLADSHYPQFFAQCLQPTTDSES